MFRAARLKPGTATMFRKLLLLAGPVAMIGGFVLANTARYRSEQPHVAPAPIAELPDGASERLAGALRIPTISSDTPGAFDPEAFEALHAYLRSAFPGVHAELGRETVGGNSLLFTWPGSDPLLDPIL